MNKPHRKPHFLSAVLLLMTGAEGLLFLLMFLRLHPGELNAFSGASLVALLWACAAALLFAAGVCVLSGRPRALVWIDKTKRFFSAQNAWARWLVPGFLALYLAASTGIIKLWGAANPLLVQLAEPAGRWFFLAAIQTVLILVFARETPAFRGFRKPAALILAGIALLWLLVVSTRIGLEPDNRYWNVAGVPILINQLGLILFLALFGIFLYGLLSRKPTINLHRREILLDLLACLILWVGAAWFWQQAPFSNSYFAKGVFPPNQDFYPYSDAALSDLGGQYMLIGKGLEYPYFTEKPLYALFLGLLHHFVGQSYLQTTTWQMICFAIFPVLLYILGKQLHNRLFGLAVALFSVAKEYNAISSTVKISVSNSRLYLSEFPTMILITALAVALVAWFKSRDEKSAWPLVAGGLLGLAAMVRTNPLILIPVGILFALWVYRGRLKQYWAQALLFLAGILLVMGPWLAFNTIKYGTDPFTYKITAVIQTRFFHREQEPAPTGIMLHDGIFQRKQLVNPADGKPADDAPLDARTGVVSLTLGHFFNNEIKSLFTLPFMLYPNKLPIVLDLPYWQEPIVWRGELPVSTFLAFVLNLILIGLGIAISWKSNGAAGLVPLAINLGYFASNALARTSGSRYLLPADWTLYFYFLLPLIMLYENGAHLRSTPPENHLGEKDNRAKARRSPASIAACAVLLFGVGSAVPLINLSYPELYSRQQTEENKSMLLSNPIALTQAGLPEQVKLLMQKENALLFEGRMLYPRYRDFSLNGETGLILTVLRPELTHVFIAVNPEELTYLEPGKDMIVLGCQRDGYVEGLAAYLPAQQILLRSTNPDLIDSCP